MTDYLPVCLGIALVAAVFALCREVRLRRALQKLLSLVLARWRAHERKHNSENSNAPSDDVAPARDRLRVVRVATQAADRQAEQNDTMAKLQQDVVGGTHQLVGADADARRELLAAHRELQAERSRLDASWSALEDERKQLARERRTESAWAAAVELLGCLSLLITLLGFCWYALVRLCTDTTTDAELNELLVQELMVGGPPESLRLKAPAKLPHGR